MGVFSHISDIDEMREHESALPSRLSWYHDICLSGRQLARFKILDALELHVRESLRTSFRMGSLPVDVLLSTVAHSNSGGALGHLPLYRRPGCSMNSIPGEVAGAFTLGWDSWEAMAVAGAVVIPLRGVGAGLFLSSQHGAAEVAMD